MPYFWAVNADASEPVLWGAAIVSMVFASLAIDALIRAGLKGPVAIVASGPAAVAEEPVDEPVLVAG